ncbi:MAG: oligopeptide/dipeptide ABC transporter ATP-binding protein [Desulfobacteraceae bacterium]|jgi:oligopeptide/dipeptide ABC transporter ATP-binding protein
MSGSMSSMAINNDKKNNTPENLVEIRNLRTWYPIRRGVLARTVGQVKAVDHVSFAIKKGETLGLVGESGCGKTTLGRTLVGLEQAQAGEILFQGRNILSMESKERQEIRRRMQMIFQDPLSSLNPRMLVRDIVTEGMRAFGMIRENQAEETAMALLGEVGMSKESLTRYPHEFSGGQCQRISIARAVSMRPDFMVLDEAVSALDVSVQAQVLNLLMDLQDKYGLTYLFISHNLSVVSHIADHVAVMYLGKMVEYGKVADVIESPVHPYTQALISAVPVPGKRTERIILQGETPSAANPPDGCPFHPRCPECQTICRTTVPRLEQADDRLFSCHMRSQHL